MNRNHALTHITVFFLCFSVSTVCGENEYEISVPHGSPPTIDGSLGVGEWNDAVLVSLNDSDVTQVAFLKYNSENLYVGLNISDSTVYEDQDSAVVLIDVNHDGGTYAQIDDIIFVVVRNGTAFEYRGDGTPTGTPTDVSGWSVATHEEYDFWTAEFKITFAKIGIIPQEDKTLGIVISAGDYYAYQSGNSYNWPPNFVGGPQIQNWGDLISAEGWRTPETSGFLIDPTLFYVMIIVAATIVALLLFFVIHRRKKPAEDIVSPPTSPQT